MDIELAKARGRRIAASVTGRESDVWDRLAEAAVKGRPSLKRQRYKILVVDDELWAALDMEWVVAKLGHEVVGSAATADDAIKLADEMRPDLVLMDIRLSDDSDGIVAATIIRQRYDIRSLFVTSHGELETRVRAEAASPAGFVEKPFAPETLARAIETALSPDTD